MARGSNETVAKRWAERVELWDRSGLSVAEFCAREGLSPPAFYQWRKRLLGGGAAVSEKTAAVFVPVEIVDTAPGTAFSPRSGREAEDGADACLVVVLPGGATVRLPACLDEQQLRRVLRAVVAETRGC